MKPLTVKPCWLLLCGALVSSWPGALVACRAEPSREPRATALSVPPPPSARPAGVAPSRPSSAPESFVATLRIDSEPGGKRFQGVWLERADGEKWVISYRADAWWRPFQERRVRAEGESYQPEGQAVGAHHFRVRSLWVLDPKSEPLPRLIEIHEEQTLTGSFGSHTWPAGTKLEGETETRFVAGSESYQLANVLEAPPPLGKTVTVRAREVVPSPFMTRAGGRVLWIISVEP